MPRTRRTPASENPAAEDAAPAETPPVTSLAPTTDQTADQTTTEAPKPVRRRAPRKPKAEDSVTDTPETETPVTADTPPNSAPTRRRGRRPASEAAPAEAASPAASSETPTRTRRGRRAAGSESASVEAVTQTPAPHAEPASAEAAPQGSRRRGRTRQAASETEASASSTAPTDAAPTPKRRRGQPRAEKAEMPSVSDALAEAAEGTPTEEATPARRRRGRRPAAVLETPADTVELPDLEAPVVEDSEDAETADETGKPGKRSRRSRRRRGDRDEPTTEMLEAAGAPLLLDETAVEAVTPEEEEDDFLPAWPPPAPPVYVAPPIVPPVFPPADTFQTPRISARVVHPARGLARIAVGGAEHLPFLFFVNAEAAQDGETVEAQIREAAANGIHLFSGVMYLPLRNAYGDRSFGAIDALIQQVLMADPDGFLLPRLQFVPTNYWVRTHDDQLARYADGSEGDVSLASTEFWADCVDALDALVAHFSDPSTPGGDRVLGFHLDRGEWFYDASAGYDVSPPNQMAFQNWLHAKYQGLPGLRAAWHDASVTWEDAMVPAWQGQAPAIKKTDTPLYADRREGRWVDYARFSSDLVADVIQALAETVKVLSHGNLIVAVSYGYTLEFAGRNDSGHLALGRLLESPHIDIVAGPNSYAGRAAGSPAAFGAPVDSVALHGKLWLVEDDTKTFLADAETDDDYNPKILSGADTQAIHQRHFGAALAHTAGVTWMDLWGQGWLNSPDIWRELGRLRDQAARCDQIAPAQAQSPDVVVLIDEASLAYLKNDADGLGMNLIGRTRDLLLRAGGSVGFYLQSDVVRDDFPAAKLYLFLNALRLTTTERQAIREKLQRPGKTLAWLYAPGLFDENGPSSEEVGEVVGMALRRQPWNSRGGSQPTDAKHPITERIRGIKRIGQEEILNPLFAVTDPQATVVAEYAASGAASLATREHKGGWKSVFFGDPYLTTELLRGLYAYAGVLVYDAQDDIVYAGENGALAIHGSFTGQRTIALPRQASVYDVAEDKIIASGTRTFRTFVRARTTRLFLWGGGEALAAATDLALPAPSAAEPQELPRVQEPPRVSPPPLLSREEFPRESAAMLHFNDIPGLESVGGPLADSEDAPGEDEPGMEKSGEGDAAGEVRRSRWQRRRAAARARRDAERAAQSAEGAPDRGNAANPPVDIESLLPGLPPRRTPAQDDMAAERVAEIVSLDITHEFTLGSAEDEEA